MAPSFVRAIGAAALLLPFVFSKPFEQLDELPKDWAFARHADLEHSVKLYVSVREQNLEYFEQLVLDISNPDHPSYGEHLEDHEISNILRPTDEATDAVMSWLRNNNVTALTDEGDLVHFVTTIGNANKMFDTEFAWYKAKDDDRHILRTLGYSVPHTVAPHIDFVSPTIKFGSVKPYASTIHSVGAPLSLAELKSSVDSAAGPQTTAPPDAECNELITPQCLLNLYNVHYKANPKNGNKVAYGSFLDEYARNTDLTLFETEIASYAMGQSFSVVEFHGGQNDQTSTNDSTEANLDNQYIISVAYPVPVTEFSTGGCGPQIPDQDEPAGKCDNEPYLPFVQGLLKLPKSKLPQTLSISYGDDEQTIPPSFAKKICHGFMKLGARGTSVMFASGDSGPGKTCENNNGTVKKFVPAFPASCPWVTTVGATQGVPTEVGADFTGGGFSNIFARPAYQQTAVSAYLKSIGTTFSQYYNAAGRGYPDVSAQGVNYLVVNTGAAEPVDGTSCASPTFSAIIALLNSARISSGKKPLGFLNPFLYSKGYKALNDITSGGSTGCSGTIAGASWNATAGWDPATGLGTPNFGKLLGLTSPSACNIGGPLPNPTLTSCKK